MLCRRTIVVVALLATASSAAADPIRIVAGSLVFERDTGAARITLIGDSEGFTLDGAILNRDALGPLFDCSVPECVPGTTVTLRTPITDVGAVSTFRGETYPTGGIAPTSAGVFLVFDGDIPIPSGFTGGTLTGSFTFNGTFFYPGPPNNTPYQAPPLIGQGVASITLAPWGSAFPEAFVVRAVRYDFTGTEPVPEPATALLIGSGIGCLAAVRRRRRATKIN